MHPAGVSFHFGGGTLPSPTSERSVSGMNLDRVSHRYHHNSQNHGHEDDAAHADEEPEDRPPTEAAREHAA